MHYAVMRGSKECIQVLLDYTPPSDRVRTINGIPTGWVSMPLKPAILNILFKAAPPAEASSLAIVCGGVQEFLNMPFLHVEYQPEC
jgi:hypothetical protein